jgi:hypothetical protein
MALGAVQLLVAQRLGKRFMPLPEPILGLLQQVFITFLLSLLAVVEMALAPLAAAGAGLVIKTIMP